MERKLPSRTAWSRGWVHRGHAFAGRAAAVDMRERRTGIRVSGRRDGQETPVNVPIFRCRRAHAVI